MGGGEAFLEVFGKTYINLTLAAHFIKNIENITVGLISRNKSKFTDIEEFLPALGEGATSVCKIGTFVEDQSYVDVISITNGNLAC